MSTEATPAAAEGPLSVDQAVAQLDARHAALEAPSAEAVEEEEDQESEADPTAEDDADPEEAIGDEEDAELESDPDAPVIAAPTSWDAQERAEFATLPLKAQQIIVAREAERDKAVSKALQEASEAKRTAGQEVQKIAQLHSQLQDIVPKAEKAFGDRWSNVDWVAWASQDPAAAQIGRFQYEAEQRELQNTRAVADEARRVSQQQFLAQESEKLKTLVPELVDPVRGAANKQALAQHLIERGADPRLLETMSADAISVAWDAYQFRRLKAGAKPQAKPAQAAAKPVVKPTGSVPVRSPQMQVQQASNRFAQTRSVEDAIALLNAKSARKAS